MSGLRSSEGPRKKLGHISFGAFDDDFDRFAERLQKLGVKRLDPPPGVETNGLWFHDHDGNLVEIKVAAKSSPSEKSDFAEVAAGPGQRGAPFRRDVARVRPRRLAHVLLFTRDVEKAVQFYTRTLGLRLSDRSGDGIAFLHGIHGSDHHMIAFVTSSAPGLHHLSWDVGSVDDIGRGATHMLGQRLRAGLGPRTACPGLQLFPLCRRSVGLFQRIFGGHRLCARRLRLGERRPRAGGFVLRVGAEPAGLFHPQRGGVSRSPLLRERGDWASGLRRARLISRAKEPTSFDSPQSQGRRSRTATSPRLKARARRRRRRRHNEVQPRRRHKPRTVRPSAATCRRERR